MIELPSNQYPRLGSKEREWAWFGSLLVGLSLLIIALRLVMSGDVELNPGPLDSGLVFFFQIEWYIIHSQHVSFTLDLLSGHNFNLYIVFRPHQHTYTYNFIQVVLLI